MPYIGTHSAFKRQSKRRGKKRGKKKKKRGGRSAGNSQVRIPQRLADPDLVDLAGSQGEKKGGKRGEGKKGAYLFFQHTFVCDAWQHDRGKEKKREEGTLASL